MKFYCGIDLSARDFHLCVIDEQSQIMVREATGFMVSPAWLFGAVHSRAELRLGLVRPKTPAGLLPPTRL